MSPWEVAQVIDTVEEERRMSAAAMGCKSLGEVPPACVSLSMQTWSW